MNRISSVVVASSLGLLLAGTGGCGWQWWNRFGYGALAHDACRKENANKTPGPADQVPCQQLDRATGVNFEQYEAERQRVLGRAGREHAGVAAETALDLTFVDDHGAPVRPVTAEVLVVAWGEIGRLPIPAVGEVDRLRLPLTADWLHTRWPDRFDDLERAYLYFQAPGFAPIRSAPFVWPGARGAAAAPAVTPDRIALQNGAPVTIAAGEVTPLRVMFRRPQPRRLRLVDIADRPLAGISVRAGMFWSASDHCGALSGNDPLGQSVSDIEGVVAIADGDIEYAFEFDSPDHYILAEVGDNRFGTPRWITSLTATETVVRFRQFERRPLLLRASVNGAAAAGRTLSARLANCGCGACSGPLATTDANGEIRLPDFRPERYAELYFEEPDGNASWRIEASKLTGTEPIQADLSL